MFGRGAAGAASKAAGEVLKRRLGQIAEHVGKHTATHSGGLLNDDTPSTPGVPQSAPPYLQSMGIPTPSPAAMLVVHSALFSPSPKSQQVFQFPPPAFSGTPRPSAPSLSSGVDSTPQSAIGPRSSGTRS